MERRFWFGLGILVLFLALGLWTAWGMEHMHRPVTQQLEQAARTALEGDAETAAQQARVARDIWQQGRGLTAAVADHEPMEEIDGLFAQAEVYAHAGENTEFAAYCTRIARLVEAVGEAHRLNWQNLL